ncbi:MAG TPA: ammonium transporter, partial [Alphaproteobacteria bacterium]|nr:ammonium transporter [Alphaproteobacteria bacterium]
MTTLIKRLTLAGLATFVTALTFVSTAAAKDAIFASADETAYIFNTFSFLFNGALVMWMAAGFCMLEAGLVRSKSVATICTKNIALYSIAGITYFLVGYNLMYDGVNGGFMGSFSWSNLDGPAYVEGDGYAVASDWFFQ